MTRDSEVQIEKVLEILTKDSDLTMEEFDAKVLAIFNASIVEETLKEHFPTITAEDIAEMQKQCSNPWDAVPLYQIIQLAKKNNAG